MIARSRCPAAPFLLLAVLVAFATPISARADDPAAKPVITIQPAAGDISIDGDLSDAGWQGLTPITTWFETNPGDNIEPPVKNVAYLAYDEHYLYAGFQLADPNPSAIRAPLGDHDAVPGSTDYAGVIVDSHNDGKTAQMFLANPRGVQYDAVSSDATGEDNAPDYYWDSAGKITGSGWSLEIRVPFSSLRYTAQTAEPTWGMLLYRNYPRDRRYQFFTARLPRDVNCFICNSSKMVGLTNLPHGSHLVVAPYATAQQSAFPHRAPGGTPILGTALENEDADFDGGADIKWSPGSSVAIDATVNPDFSQIESDVAQIVANERFALNYPEKRPFFLEGVDLLSTPLNVAYTRTVTAPSAGVRATGKLGETAYTALFAHDRGGGIVILPGPQVSRGAFQDFQSDVGIFRVRHDLGRSFVSLLGTARVIEDGGNNVVIGPDFQWRPRGSDSFTAQALFSNSETPNRPTLASEWDGRTLTDHAIQAQWSHSTRTWDWFVAGQDIGPDFRADNGFIPQVGYREAYLENGYTVRPQKSFFSRVRTWAINYVDVQMNGDVLDQRVAAGASMDGRWNSFIRIELNEDGFRIGHDYLKRFRPRLQLQVKPGRVLNDVSIDTYAGEEVDFANARVGHGASITSSATVRPNYHLELLGNFSVRWLDVHAGPGLSGRLFTATVSRLRTTWAFNSRSFVRLIGQYVQTHRDRSLYDPVFFPDAPPEKSADFSSSALFAYKLNWQTVVYAGYGDAFAYHTPTDQLEPRDRQVFAKVSYAWQQ